MPHRSPFAFDVVAVLLFLREPGTDVYGDIEAWGRGYLDSGQAAREHAAIVQEHTTRLAHSQCRGWGDGQTVWQEPEKEW